MMTNHDVLSVYEAVVDLTEQMVQAASSGDWDELVVLEERCSVHVQSLQHGEATIALTEPGRQKKAAIIKKILADDRKIRDLTMPWMAQLSALINSTGTEKRLASAYGAV
jgi:flagellar protein FliT